MENNIENYDNDKYFQDLLCSKCHKLYYISSTDKLCGRCLQKLRQKEQLSSMNSLMIQKIKEVRTKFVMPNEKVYSN